MNKTTRNNRITHRYISAKNEGQEFYVENIGMDTPIEIAVKEPALKARLTLFKQAMPKATIRLTVEEEWTDRTWKVYDVETGTAVRS